MSIGTKRLLLIGWDSADWNIIHPLVDSGKMPTLAHLLDTGISGNLTTIEPQLSPMLWTSIATGKHAYQHGVPGFTEVNDGGQVVPVSAATRRCKALWDMLGEKGLKSHVVSWFATQGERPVDGCLVSNLYQSWKHSPEADPAEWPAPPPGTYWPVDLAQHLNERRVSPYEIDPDEVLRLFVPEAPLLDQKKDRRLAGLAARLSEAFSVQSASTWLLEHRNDWNLSAVYFRAIDEICHQFMHYHPPQMEGVKDEDFAMYQHVVNASYRLHDLFLANLLNLAGPDTAVVLVSDHGFHSDHRRPKFTPRVPAGITVWHRPQGIFVASGPGFQKDKQVFGARLLDVAPTILSWFGLPVGKDMEGRVLTDAFESPTEIQWIDSWEATGIPRTSSTILSGGDQKALLDQFVELGYIDPVSVEGDQAAIETNRENDWNMARACMDGARYEEALPLLESCHIQQPWRNDYAQMLAICQLRLGLLAEAHDTMASCAEKLGKESPGLWIVRANIALEMGHAHEATSYLEHAQVQSSQDPQCLLLVARTHFMLRHWEQCAQCCERILSLDPTHVGVFPLLSRLCLRTGDLEGAADHAMTTISLQYGDPRGHFLLGVAMARLKDWEVSLKALERAIQLQPNHAAAYRIRGHVLLAMGQATEAVFSRQRARITRALTHQKSSSAPLQSLRDASAQRTTLLREKIAAIQAEGLVRQQEAEKHALPPDQEFIIVSGLPRSGTSLMMQMLRAGGIQPMTDGERKPDESNPEGYWEWEEIKQLPRNPRLIEKAHGKVVKVITSLLPALPPRHRYKVIFMQRPIREVVQSQAKMIQSHGGQPHATPQHLETIQSEQVEKLLAAMQKSDRFDLITIDYTDVIRNPAATVEALQSFLSDKLPEPSAMLACVRPELYRNREKAMASPLI